MHICFVCSGNICRSPMAAKVFGEHLRRAGLDEHVRVTSAGTGRWHIGEPADPRAADVLRAHGYPTEHSAEQVGSVHLDADLLLVADSGHMQALRTRVPEPARVRLLRSFDPSAADGAEVADPYYGGGRGFDDVLAMIEAAMPHLLDWVRARL